MVFLVDDDASVRGSLKRLLEISGYRVEAYESAGGFLENLPYEGEACIVTDLRMPGMSGIEFQEAARARGCELPFVFISGHGEVCDAVTAMKGGAVDFLEKPLDSKAFLDAIDRALGLARGTRAKKSEGDKAQRLLATLTPRERQVTELVGQGLLNKQIAAQLGTSEKTVKAQRGRAMKKLNANSPAALVDILRNAAGRS